MRLIAMAPLAVAVSAAGGFGFIGAADKLSEVDSYLEQAARLIKENPDQGHAGLQSYYEKTGVLPVGFGLFSWAAAEELEKAVAAVAKWKPAAVWLFGAHRNSDYAVWTEKIRRAGGGRTAVWVQVGSVRDALEVGTARGEARPDVLVVQGTDAGGHGLETGAGIVSLVPEVADALEAEGLKGDINLIAAGGIVDGRGAAAALMLGADGVCLGTRFLASEEASVAEGYRREVVRASDGGLNTARTKVYDQLRGITLWPKGYNARGVLNQSFHDHNGGMTLEENKKLYDEAMEKEGDGGWGVGGRITTYAGTGVGLVRSVMKGGDIVREVQQQTLRRLKAVARIPSYNVPSSR